MGTARTSIAKSRLAACFAVAWLVPVCTGCTMWEPVESPRDFIENEKPASVRVHYEVGRPVTLTSPVLRNDSVVGLSELCAGASAACADERVAPLDGITALEVRRVSVGRTAVAVVGSVAAVLVIGLLSWANGSG